VPYNPNIRQALTAVKWQIEEEDRPLSILVATTHFGLAVALFFAVNWIGEHSLTLGYLQLSLKVQGDSAPAFNFLLKALAPTVYIILAATMFYLLHRDSFVQHIWLIAVYYFAFRFSFNLAMGRLRLLNWLSVAMQTTFGISAAYLAYARLILPRQPLFPDFQDIGHQMWVIIALFLYAALNSVRTPTTASTRRKNAYLRSRFSTLRKEYGNLIDDQFSERYMELVVYAILIYETFNRPWLVRSVERVLFPWMGHTLGPMQVRTETKFSDREGLVVGTQRLKELFGKTKEELSGKPSSRYEVIRFTLAKYNRDDYYINEIFGVLHTLWTQVALDYRTEFETMHVRPAV
jgi:hypothetical protein